MSKKKHTHKLKRHKYRNNEEIYFCVLDCSFRVKCELAEGLKAVCHRCGLDFIMTQKSCELSKPHCDKCTRSKKREADEILAALEPTLAVVSVNKPVKELKNEPRVVSGHNGGQTKHEEGLKSLRERLLGSVRETLNSSSDDML